MPGRRRSLLVETRRPRRRPEVLKSRVKISNFLDFQFRFGISLTKSVSKWTGCSVNMLCLGLNIIF